MGHRPSRKHDEDFTISKNLRPHIYLMYILNNLSSEMTVTDGGLESFLEYREIIAHIAGSKLIFLVWVRNKMPDF